MVKPAWAVYSQHTPPYCPATSRPVWPCQSDVTGCIVSARLEEAILRGLQ